MRWEALFADLEAQLVAAEPEQGLAAELVRAEVAQVALVDRLRAHLGVTVRLRLPAGLDEAGHGRSLTGELLDAGADWLLLAQGNDRVLVPSHALLTISGLSRAVAPAAGPVASRLRLPVVLRALARDRAAVRLEVSGQLLSGTIDRVGADHLDLAEHPADQARRARAVREVLTVPLAALVAVRSTD